MSTIQPHNKNRFYLAFLCLLINGTLFLHAEAFTFAPVRPVIVSARTTGFGGSFSALEAGFDTLSTNPAALAYVKEEWSIARLAIEVSGPLFDLPAVAQADDMQTAIINLVNDNNGVYIGMNITGPLTFGKVDKNFGFGVFNRTLTTADIPGISRATVMAGEEFLLVGGYGLSLYENGPHSIALGLQMKGFFQTFLFERGSTLTVLNSFMKLKVNNIPTVLSTGFGVDLGVMYRLNNRFNAAITCQDLYTPVFSTRYSNVTNFLSGTPDSTVDTLYDRLSPNLSAGVVYSIPLPENWISISNWNVMLDYRNALDFLKPLHRNLIMNIAVGTEIILLDVVSLRTGISDTYLSTGLGLDLTVCQIDFAMYGKELGIEPGKRPLLNMALSVSFEY